MVKKKSSPLKIFLIIINCIIILSLLLVSAGVVAVSLNKNILDMSFFVTDQNIHTSYFENNCFIAVKQEASYKVGDRVIYALQTDEEKADIFICEAQKIKGDKVYVSDFDGALETKNIMGKVIFSNRPLGYLINLVKDKNAKQLIIAIAIAAFVILGALIIMINNISKLRKAKKEQLKETSEEQSLDINELIEVEEEVLLFRQEKE